MQAIASPDALWPRPEFFPGAELNFAENLLYPKADPSENSYAVIEASETSRGFVTWRELRERVRQCSIAMRNAGVKEGDRVAAYVANHCNALVAMLSATSIGAVWTAISPDTGVPAVLDRFQQIAPTLIFADNAVVYNGKVHQTYDKLREILNGLPNLATCVVFETVSSAYFDITGLHLPRGSVIWYSEFVQRNIDDSALEFAQLKPDQPVYILISSCTT